MSATGSGIVIEFSKLQLGQNPFGLSSGKDFNVFSLYNAYLRGCRSVHHIQLCPDIGVRIRTVTQQEGTDKVLLEPRFTAHVRIYSFCIVRMIIDAEQLAFISYKIWTVNKVLRNMGSSNLTVRFNVFSSGFWVS